jgi:hypothetical protein
MVFAMSGSYGEICGLCADRRTFPSFACVYVPESAQRWAMQIRQDEEVEE